MDEEADRAAILEIDRADAAQRGSSPPACAIPNGMAWQPQTGALWTVVNERDELGSDLVPDYMTSVQDGGFYGWPYSYFGQHVDDAGRAAAARTWSPRRSCRTTRSARTPPRSGLTFYDGDAASRRAIAGGAFIGQHGSWNRKPRSGYKVIFVPFADGKPSGPPSDVLTGFLNDDGRGAGPPGRRRLDKQGALLVADDVGNAVWRVTPAGAQSAAR